mgnify:CR=1 FL=1
MTILHIIPELAFVNTYHGTYKDVISRVRWFEEHVRTYQQVRFTVGQTIRLTPELPSNSPDGIVVEYTRFPRLLRDLRRRYPAAKLASRAINAEPLQFLDNQGWFPRRGPVWVLYGMLRLLINDAASRAQSDVVLSISDWESRTYWRRLPGRTPVTSLPYYCPDHLVPKEPLPHTARHTIACLPTSQKNRKSWDLVTRFYRFAEMMKAAGSDDAFVVTGDLDDWGLPDSTAVKCVGMIDDLSTFLASVRAVCVLSPLGYGFKTTIGDALAAGAGVIAHPAILQRCPDDIRNTACAVDTRTLNPAQVNVWLQTRNTNDMQAAYRLARSRNHAALADWIAHVGRSAT